MFGFININKPKGMTSHDVVATLRRLTNIRQIGHTGTLDPFAEGVLPVCIGRATRLIEFLEDDKAYLATVQFGSNTDTYDIDGQITETFEKKVTREEVENALQNFRGEIEQMPPIYSAIKVNGKKLYEYARNGEEVKIQPRRVNIELLELKDFDAETQKAVLEVKCSKGTYIRSIAYDLGKVLGTGGHLTALVRTKAGCFTIENAIPLQKLVFGDVKSHLINPIDVIPYEKIEVKEEDIAKIQNGVALRNYNIENGKFVLLTKENNICAIGFSEDNVISQKKVFL